jgi:hypothetical protein
MGVILGKLKWSNISILSLINEYASIKYPSVQLWQVHGG